MALERPAFTPLRLEEERKKDKDKVFTVRLNAQEIAWLEEIKEDLNIDSDGKALKMAAFIGRRVLHSHFGRDFLKYLFSGNRERLSDYKRLDGK